MSTLKIMENALKKIACLDDANANAIYHRCGSYSGFDEPGSVEIARNALKSVKNLRYKRMRAKTEHKY